MLIVRQEKVHLQNTFHANTQILRPQYYIFRRKIVNYNVYLKTTNNNK